MFVGGINKFNLYEKMSNVWRVTRPKINTNKEPRQFIKEYSYSIIDDLNKGKCVVATKKIEIGSWICEYIGEVYSQADFTGDFRYSFALLNDYIIDASRIFNISRYINHSCDPNCAVEEIIWSNLPHLVISAIKM